MYHLVMDWGLLHHILAASPKLQTSLNVDVEGHAYTAFDMDFYHIAASALALFIVHKQEGYFRSFMKYA